MRPTWSPSGSLRLWASPLRLRAGADIEELHNAAQLTAAAVAASTRPRSVRTSFRYGKRPRRPLWKVRTHNRCRI